MILTTLRRPVLHHLALRFAFDIPGMPGERLDAQWRVGAGIREFAGLACGENGIVGIRIETDLRSHVDCDHPNRSKVRVRQGPQFSLLVMQRDRAILAVLLGCALRQSELECGANVLPSGGRKSPRARPPGCIAGS